MVAAITHATEATGVDSGDGKISKNAWNEGHDLSGTIPVANLPVGTTASDVAAGNHAHPASPPISAAALIYAYSSFR